MTQPDTDPCEPDYPLIDSRGLRELFLDARLRWHAQPAAVGAEADLDAAWRKLEDSLDNHPILRQQVLGDAAVPGHRPGSGRLSVRAVEWGHETVRSLLGLADPPAQGGEASDPLPVLPPVREAVRLMEAVYFRLRLGGSPGSAAHRRSLPWLNRFGRWTGADHFRRWWPWLVPLHDSDFVRFVERELSLPSVAEHYGYVRALTLSADRDAYALRRWRDELSREPAEEDAVFVEGGKTTLFGFFLCFGSPWRDLNAAVAVVDCWPRGGIRIARWRAEDLYVPPGLWGIGIGERFLTGLLEELTSDGCHSARVEAPTTGGAHWHTLYSGAELVRRTENGSTFFEKELAPREV